MTEAPSGRLTRSWEARPATAPSRPAPATAVPYDLVLDWGSCRISQRRRPCRHCRRGAFMLDPDGQPCHKTCEERYLLRSRGLAGAYAAVRASYRPRATTRNRAGS